MSIVTPTLHHRLDTKLNIKGLLIATNRRKTHKYIKGISLQIQEISVKLTQ